MARWRLRGPHYLNVVDTPSGPIEWEYKEQDKVTGRSNRKVFKVPLYLDPANPQDCNQGDDIIVAYAKGASRNDIIFEGEPGPDMEPMDEEAEKISKALEKKWVHPIEGLAGEASYSQSLLSSLGRQLTELTKMKAAEPAPAVSANSIAPDELAKLKAQMEELVKSNADLQARLAGAPPIEPLEDLDEEPAPILPAKPVVERRV